MTRTRARYWLIVIDSCHFRTNWIGYYISIVLIKVFCLRNFLMRLLLGQFQHQLHRTARSDESKENFQYECLGYPLSLCPK